jgi:hypothetical protein
MSAMSMQHHLRPIPNLYAYNVNWDQSDEIHENVVESMHDFHDVFAEVNEEHHQLQMANSTYHDQDDGRDQILKMIRPRTSPGSTNRELNRVRKDSRNRSLHGKRYVHTNGNVFATCCMLNRNPSVHAFFPIFPKPKLN